MCVCVCVCVLVCLRIDSFFVLLLFCFSILLTAEITPTLNKYITEFVSTAKLDIFDKKDNSLDPIDFNGHASAEAHGEACLDQKCFTIFGKRICTPK